MPFDGSGRGHIDWTRLRSALERLIAEQRPRPAGDPDAHAVRFLERLEDAISGLDTGRHRFEHATRKPDHVDELRRILGVLLDVLADWEQAAERA